MAAPRPEKPCGDRSPREYKRLLQAIADFRDDYEDYINRTAPAIYAGDPPVRDAERTDLVRRSVLAGQAVSTADVRLEMGPAGGGGVLSGVAPLAFAHEDQRFQGSPFGHHYERPHDMVIDALDHAAVILGQRAKESHRLRRRPACWLWLSDRFLRATLGFPGYLLSVIFGFDRRELPESRRRLTDFVSLAGSAASIFGVGKFLNWW